MPETKRRASLNFFQGADGPTLMFLMFEDADLSGLKALFLGLANGEHKKVSLRAAGIVGFASAIDDVVFVRLSGALCSSFADIRRAGSYAQNWSRVLVVLNINI